MNKIKVIEGLLAGKYVMFKLIKDKEWTAYEPAQHPSPLTTDDKVVEWQIDPESDIIKAYVKSETICTYGDFKQAYLIGFEAGKQDESIFDEVTNQIEEFFKIG